VLKRSENDDVHVSPDCAFIGAICLQVIYGKIEKEYVAHKIIDLETRCFFGGSKPVCK